MVNQQRHYEDIPNKLVLSTPIPILPYSMQITFMTSVGTCFYYYKSIISEHSMSGLIGGSTHKGVGLPGNL